MAHTNPCCFDTQVIHTGQSPASWDGATLLPIFQTASYLHQTAESLCQTFPGQIGHRISLRLSNPAKRFPKTIGKEVIIYPTATILDGETVIGAGTTIGGNVWITESVPPDTKVILNHPKPIYLSR